MPGPRRLVHAAVLAAAATGLVLLWTRYVTPSGDEIDPPPLDATSQHLHVLVVPITVFALGVLWPTHILPNLRAGDSLRPSGLILLALSLPMVAAGYGLQVATSETWRAILGWTHAVSGAAWLLLYVAHAAGARRFARARERYDAAMGPAETGAERP